MLASVESIRPSYVCPMKLYLGDFGSYGQKVMDDMIDQSRSMLGGSPKIESIRYEDISGSRKYTFRLRNGGPNILERSITPEEYFAGKYSRISPIKRGHDGRPIQ